MGNLVSPLPGAQDPVSPAGAAGKRLFHHWKWAHTDTGTH